MMHRRMFGKAALAAAAALALTALGSRAARAEERPYPNLVHAKWEMEQAKDELKAERFSRYRERLIHELEGSIDEVDRALRFAKVGWKYEGPDNPREVYRDYKDFPHMRHALHELREAKRELVDEKGHDWGGRRDRAIDAVQGAIDRLEEALKD